MLKNDKKINTYSIENESCPECDQDGEMIYNQYANGIHCQACNTWFNTNMEVQNASNS